MINLRDQQVNVNRLELIEAIKKGLEIHKAKYKESLEDYKEAVKIFMREALVRAEAEDFKDLVLTIQAPFNKESEYLDVIEMLEVSVDETIQLDKESYKAFYKNEWSWTGMFEASASLYKTVIGGSNK